MRASVANKLDPGKFDFVREYLEAAAAAESERCGGEWAVKGQLMRGGRVGTELVQKLLQRLTGKRPLTPTAVDSFLSVVGKDTGTYHTTYRVLTKGFPFEKLISCNLSDGLMPN